MAQYIPMLEFYSDGRIPLVCTMYASSESYFGVNLRLLCSPKDVSYTILPSMAYFEFVPFDDGLKSVEDDEVVENDKLVSLVDVKVGCYYEFVVTTFVGKNTSCKYITIICSYTSTNTQS
jgi:auxin responsive GH3 family protein